jgi:hypothetical protein
MRHRLPRLCGRRCGPADPLLGAGGLAVGAHCEHLGIDLDQLGALLQAEHREGSE